MRRSRGLTPELNDWAGGAWSAGDTVEGVSGVSGALLHQLRSHPVAVFRQMRRDTVLHLCFTWMDAWTFSTCVLVWLQGRSYFK